MSRSSPSNRCPTMCLLEQLIDLVDVEVVGEYAQRLTFADGTVGGGDFARRQWRGVFQPVRDPAYFARVAVDPEAGPSAGPTGSTWHPSRCMPRTAGTSPTPPLPRRSGRAMRPVAAASINRGEVLCWA